MMSAPKRAKVTVAGGAFLPWRRAREGGGVRRAGRAAKPFARPLFNQRKCRMSRNISGGERMLRSASGVALIGRPAAELQFGLVLCKALPGTLQLERSSRSVAPRPAATP